MSIDQRKYLRDLQDRIITIADDRNMDGDLRLSVDEPASPTIREMRTAIYPQWQATMERVLHQLQQS